MKIPGNPRSKKIKELGELAYQGCYGDFDQEKVEKTIDAAVAPLLGILECARKPLAEDARSFRTHRILVANIDAILHEWRS